MKTTLTAVTTINGYIANMSGQYPWASSEDRYEFEKIYKDTGCIIIGRVTYEILKKRNPFPTPGRLCVVVSHDSSLISDNPNIVFVSSPKVALAYLEKNNYKHALIGGGEKLNTSFLKEGLIDEMILTVEPVIIVNGVTLFSTGEIEKNLKLITLRQLNQNTIQLHYKVHK